MKERGVPAVRSDSHGSVGRATCCIGHFDMLTLFSRSQWEVEINCHTFMEGVSRGSVDCLGEKSPGGASSWAGTGGVCAPSSIPPPKPNPPYVGGRVEEGI